MLTGRKQVNVRSVGRFNRWNNLEDDHVSKGIGPGRSLRTVTEHGKLSNRAKCCRGASTIPLLIDGGIKGTVVQR